MRDFLRGHSCYELIPESGKVVLLDTGLPIRQAFHALHEQVPSVPTVFESTRHAKNKGVLLDIGLPIRQAFHALHERLSPRLMFC